MFWGCNSGGERLLDLDIKWLSFSHSTLCNDYIFDRAVTSGCLRVLYLCHHVLATTKHDNHMTNHMTDRMDRYMIDIYIGGWIDSFTHHSRHHLSKHHMAAIQPGRLDSGDEELGAVGILARVCHA